MPNQRLDIIPSISVVIPCYNEEAVIERSYRRVKRALDRQTADHEILIANDGSSDHSADILLALAKQDPSFVFINYQPNRGMGHACRKMYERASKDIVIQMDADLAMNPEETIPAFVREVREVDCVVGSRFKGIDADYPLRRRVASHGYYLVNRLLFDFEIRDTQSGFFGIRRPILQSLPLHSDGFEIHVEMFAQLERRGHTIREIPVRFVHQTESGEVSVFKAAPRMFFGSLRIWRSLRRQRLDELQDRNINARSHGPDRR